MFNLFNTTLGTFLFCTTRGGRTDLQITDSDNLHLFMHLIEKLRRIRIIRAYNMGVKVEFPCSKTLKKLAIIIKRFSVSINFIESLVNMVL